MLEQLDARRSRGGWKPPMAVGEHRSQRSQRDAVDILLRRKQLAHASFVHKRRKRPEQQASVHVRIVVDFAKRSLQSLLRRELVKGDGAHGDAEGVGALASGALIGQVVGTRPHAHDRKRRLDAGPRKRVDARREICRQALDDGFSTLDRVLMGLLLCKGTGAAGPTGRHGAAGRYETATLT